MGHAAIGAYIWNRWSRGPTARERVRESCPSPNRNPSVGPDRVRDSATAVPISCDEQSNDPSSGISLLAFNTSHLFYTSDVTAQVQIRVKLNRVFFPRYRLQARSLDCGFAGLGPGTVGISLIHSCASLIRRRGIWLP